MKNQEAINILLNERKCIDRNDGIQCDRKCESCDLVMDAEPIREAYSMAISALQALDEIYAFIMKSEASETTDGILEIFDALEERDAPDTNVDTISRLAAINDLHTKDPSMIWDTADVEVWVNALPSAQPEIIPSTIDYYYCSNTMLKMWIDNVLTDGEYNKIMDKLNDFERRRRENENG